MHRHANLCIFLTSKFNYDFYKRCSSESIYHFLNIIFSSSEMSNRAVFSEDDSRRLVVGITDFLRDQLTVRNDFDPEDRDCLEIAIQSLEMAYGLDPNGYVQLRFARPLLDIFTQVTNPISVRDRLRADAHKNDGNDFIRTRMFANAEREYTAAIELDPWNSIYYCNRAGARIEQHNYFNAISDCRQALMLNPDYAKAYGRMGQAYALLHRNREAARCFRQALELEPENESYRNNLTVAEQQINQTDAVGIFTSLLDALLGRRPQATTSRRSNINAPTSFMIITESHPTRRDASLQNVQDSQNSDETTEADVRESVNQPNNIVVPSSFGVVDEGAEERSVLQQDSTSSDNNRTDDLEFIIEFPGFAFFQGGETPSSKGDLQDSASMNAEQELTCDTTERLTENSKTANNSIHSKISAPEIHENDTNGLLRDIEASTGQTETKKEFTENDQQATAILATVSEEQISEHMPPYILQEFPGVVELPSKKEGYKFIKSKKKESVPSLSDKSTSIMEKSTTSNFEHSNGNVGSMGESEEIKVTNKLTSDTTEQFTENNKTANDSIHSKISAPEVHKDEANGSLRDIEESTGKLEKEEEFIENDQQDTTALTAVSKNEIPAHMPPYILQDFPDVVGFPTKKEGNDSIKSKEKESIPSYPDKSISIEEENTPVNLGHSNGNVASMDEAEESRVAIKTTTKNNNKSLTDFQVESQSSTNVCEMSKTVESDQNQTEKPNDRKTIKTESELFLTIQDLVSSIRENNENENSEYKSDTRSNIKKESSDDKEYPN